MISQTRHPARQSNLIFAKPPPWNVRFWTKADIRALAPMPFGMAMIFTVFPCLLHAQRVVLAKTA
jgi:hypothetical protein